MLSRKPDVCCFLSSSDGIARWALEVGEKRSFLSSTELHEKSEGLVESIALVFHSLLERENLKVSDIKQVTFILGPGSFTSLRTSYSFLRGLIAPNKMKLIGMSSFLAYILGEKIKEKGNINICIKANAQENFVSKFFIESPEYIESFEPEAKSIQESLALECEEIQDGIDTNIMIEASHMLSNIDKDSLRSLVETGHLCIGSEICELLYIKGVSAKTLVERGMA